MSWTFFWFIISRALLMSFPVCPDPAAPMWETFLEYASKTGWTVASAGPIR
jgi:hypothetical protein